MDNFPLQIEIEEKKEALTKNKTISDDIEYTYFYSSYSAVSDSSTSYFSVLTSHLSEIGRFTQEDPVLQINENSFFGCGAVNITPIFEYQDNPEALNPYLYVLNNPVNATDITGEKVEICKRGRLRHWYIRFSEGEYNGVKAGFAQNPLTVRTLPPRWLKGKVYFNEPPNIGGNCYNLTNDNSKDTCVMGAIMYYSHLADAGIIKYHILFFNCHNWTRAVLGECGL